MSRISLKWGKRPLKVGFLLLLLSPDKDRTCVPWEQSQPPEGQGSPQTTFASFEFTLTGGIF